MTNRNWSESSIFNSQKNGRNYKQLTFLFAYGPNTKTVTLLLGSVPSGPTYFPGRQPRDFYEDPFSFLHSEYHKIADGPRNIIGTAVEVPPSNKIASPHLPNLQTSAPSISQPTPVVIEDEFLPSSSLSALKDAQEFTFECHGHPCNFTSVENWVNGEVKPISCHVRGPQGYFMQEGSAPWNMKLLDRFFWMFSLPHFGQNGPSLLTNKNLRKLAIGLVRLEKLSSSLVRSYSWRDASFQTGENLGVPARCRLFLDSRSSVLLCTV